MDHVLARFQFGLTPALSRREREQVAALEL
jgi:hypothetical protein